MATNRSTVFRSPIVTATLLIALSILAFVASLSVRIDANRTRADATGDAYSTLPSPEALKILSMGHETFVADLLWVRALQHNHSYDRTLVPIYADAVIHLDPEFKAVYRWAGVSMVFAGGRITAEGVETANHYLERGMQQFPNDYYYPYSIGLNLAFYYPTSSKEEKTKLMLQGVEYLQIAMQRPGVPTGTALLISGILADRTGRDAQIAFLEQAYVSEPNPEVRGQIHSRIQSLSGGDRQRRFERLRRMRERWVASNFNYAAPGLAYHIGPRSLFQPSSVLDPVPVTDAH